MHPQSQTPKRIPRFLRAAERRVLESDLQELRKTRQHAEAVGGNVPVDLNEVTKTERRIQHDIDSQSPPELNAQERDRISKRIKEDEALLVEDIPSSEEMRRNPPGAVEHHMAFERKHGKRIERWRADQRTLYNGSPDLDALTNIERLRPHNRMENMEGAAIPKTRSFFFMGGDESEHAMDWDEVFENSPSRVQAQHREELEALAEKNAKLEAEMEALRSRNEGHQKHQDHRNKR